MGVFAPVLENKFGPLSEGSYSRWCGSRAAIGRFRFVGGELIVTSGCPLVHRRDDFSLYSEQTHLITDHDGPIATRARQAPTQGTVSTAYTSYSCPDLKIKIISRRLVWRRPVTDGGRDRDADLQRGRDHHSPTVSYSYCNGRSEQAIYR